MPRVTIERDRCKGCSLCVEACPQEILEMSKEINSKGYFFAQSKMPYACIGCRICSMVCPDVVIEVGVNGMQYHPFDY